MRRVLLLISLCVAAAAARADGFADHRNRHEDSLEIVLTKRGAEMTAEEKAQTLSNLMWGFLQTDGEKSKRYATMLADHANKCGYLPTEAEAYRILGQHAWGDKDYELADSLFALAQAVIDLMPESGRYSATDVDNAQSVLCGAMANLECDKGNTNRAIELYEQMLKLLVKHGWRENQSILYYNIGELHFRERRLDMARRCYEQAIDIAREVGDSLLVAGAQKGFVDLYIELGDYDRALAMSDSAHQYYSAHPEEFRSENEVMAMQVQALRELQAQSRKLNFASTALAFILIVVLLLLLVILLQQRQRSKAEKLLATIKAKVNAEADERKRLARDLHDDIGSMMTAVSYQLEIFQHSLEQAESSASPTAEPATPTSQHPDLLKAIALLNEAHIELRRVAHHLLPNALERLGLDTALREFCQANTGVEYISIGCRPLDDGREKLLYLIAHELVSNAMHHAKASCISVQLMMDDENVLMNVSDNGTGIEPGAEEKRHGMGLENIRERLAAYDGHMDISTQQDIGTEVIISVPIGKKGELRKS